MAPVAGIGVIGFGRFICTVAIRNYLANVFGVYAASAVAAMLAVRNATSSALPLIGPPLFKKLDYERASPILARIAIALLPLPNVFGEEGRTLAGSL